MQVSLYATRPDTPNGKTSVYGSTLEETAKGWVFRWAGKSGLPNSVLEYTWPFSTATVTPGVAPFRGSATIDQMNNAVATGDLEFDLPGRSNLSVTSGPDRWGYFYYESFEADAAPSLRGPIAASAAKLRESIAGG